MGVRQRVDRLEQDTGRRVCLLIWLDGREPREQAIRQALDRRGLNDSEAEVIALRWQDAETTD